MCWTFCWTKCWTLFLSKIRILSEISISSGDRLGKLLGDGAGEGNRTLVFSLEGCCSTIELHPRGRSPITAREPPQPLCGGFGAFMAIAKGLFPRRAGRALNTARFGPYTDVSINNERRGSSVLHQALSPRLDRPLSSLKLAQGALSAWTSELRKLG